MRAWQLIPFVFVVVAGCKNPPKSEAKVLGERDSESAAKSDSELAAKSEGKSEGESEAAAPTGVYTEVAGTRGACRRTLCIGGPGEVGSHAHFDLNELCRRSRGSVQRCEDGLCTSVWPAAQWRAGLDALVTSLDRDGDGKVQAAEAECPVSLGGWSTGAGIAATQLAAALAERVPDVQLDNLVAVAPYVANLEGPLAVDPHFTRAFVYRSTRVAEDDCSGVFEGGPWTSPTPSCAEGTTCFDYDYAAQGDLLAYIGRRGNRTGWEIDHCMMTSFVAKLGLDNLDDGAESYSNRVPPYAGTTTRGGRDPHPVPEQSAPE